MENEVSKMNKDLRNDNIGIKNNGGSNRFAEAHAKNVAAAQRIVDNISTSSSDDEGELDEKSILDALYQHYQVTPDGANQLARTATFLENTLHSGAATCLICIGSIHRNDAIWSCIDCYCLFHLNCIRRWANDSLMQLKVRTEQQRQSEQGYYNNLGQYVAPKRIRSLFWCCPQCRKEFEPSEKPTKYKCFCGKEDDPQPQPFLVPHSCGEICGKMLDPYCGHDCKLLCHPGPCPPCAQNKLTSCLCGKSAPKYVRCANKNWTCEELCGELLLCGEHKCKHKCHARNQCPPCSNSSIQSCNCGQEVKKRNCSDLKWSCQKVCSAKYSCGIHVCRKVCHSGDCGECPLGLPRTCPCGKSHFVGSCVQAVETCGDTCQKLLPCGLHYCSQRCHRGKCNECLVITKKKCRCGLHEKELPCSKDFSCGMKCKQLRECGKHACNKKCCDGQCPPCEKICGKQLTCNKHKCQSVCHNGPCYPCRQQSQINCRCGKTHKTVPCGRERSIRIVCIERCRINSKCHHTNIHRCHKGDCPVCTQKCGLPNSTSNCGHLCMVKCHAAYRQIEMQGHKKLITFKALPHPRCEEKVPIPCIGGHEIVDEPCWNSVPKSCQRKCNRNLSCGRHTCQLVCHQVPDIKNMNQQIGCAGCEHGCDLSRPPGCTHPCTRACHLPPCQPCHYAVKVKCHCGLAQLVYKCSEFFTVTLDSPETVQQLQERLKSCGNRCLKNYVCGHRCIAICHAGKCPNPELCRKKVKIYCACKRLKVEVSCDKHRAGQTSLDCDALCVETNAKSAHDQQEQLEKLQRDEALKNQLELEQYEKKFGKRKHRKRKVQSEQKKPKSNWKLKVIYVAAASVLLASIAAAFYLAN